MIRQDGPVPGYYSGPLARQTGTMQAVARVAQNFAVFAALLQSTREPRVRRALHSPDTSAPQVPSLPRFVLSAPTVLGEPLLPSTPAPLPQPVLPLG